MMRSLVSSHGFWAEQVFFYFDQWMFFHWWIDIHRNPIFKYNMETRQQLTWRNINIHWLQELNDATIDQIDLGYFTIMLSTLQLQQWIVENCKIFYSELGNQINSTETTVAICPWIHYCLSLSNASIYLFSRSNSYSNRVRVTELTKCSCNLQK